jgi:predicted HTH transcriptional regulator
LADKIINVIRQDSTVTVAQIAEITQTPKRTGEREMKKMRDTGKLVRNGGNRFGRWEIKDN